MSKVKIIADSMSDIPKELIDKYDILVLPLTVRFGDEEFRDGIELSGEEFYQKLETSQDIPSTSQIPPANFVKAVKDVLEKGYESVIIINGSSEVSGTHHSAILAKEELGLSNIHVIDSRSLSYGCGLIVVEASKMAQEGKSVDEIINKINSMVGNIEHIFCVDTLKYLHKNGRLSTTKMALGTLLNVKPVLTIKDGKVEPLDKVRGSKKVIKRMVELSRERGLGNKEIIGLAHASNIEGAEELKREILEELKLEDIVVADIGCTIGSHAGPGTLAIFFER